MTNEEIIEHAKRIVITSIDAMMVEKLEAKLDAMTALELSEYINELRHKGAYVMAGKAPPFGDVGTTTGTADATKANEAAFRGRLGKVSNYKAPADTGSSKMPPSTSKEDSVRYVGGKKK